MIKAVMSITVIIIQAKTNPTAELLMKVGSQAALRIKLKEKSHLILLNMKSSDLLSLIHVVGRA